MKANWPNQRRSLIGQRARQVGPVSGRLARDKVRLLTALLSLTLVALNACSKDIECNPNAADYAQCEEFRDALRQQEEQAGAAVQQAVQKQAQQWVDQLRGQVESAVQEKAEELVSGIQQWVRETIDAALGRLPLVGRKEPSSQGAARRVVVFIQGVGTSLTAGVEKPNPDCPISPVVGSGTFSCIKQALTLPPYNYSTEDFLEFSYNGGRLVNGRWVPTDYECSDVARASLEANARVLHGMLRAYAEAHQKQRTEFVVVGHSLGGLVGVRMLELVRGDENWRLGAVFTLDSPLKGVSGVVLDTWDFVSERLGFDRGCRLGPDELREMGRDRSKTVSRNHSIVDAAKGRGTRIYTLGNLDDCVYKLGLCLFDLLDAPVLSLLLGHDDTGTQIIERGTVDVYDLPSLGGGPRQSHGAVLSDTGMKSRIAEYIGAQLSP